MRLEDLPTLSAPDHLPCELYRIWRSARDEARAALDAWNARPFNERSEAYAVYRAAADREDAAAECFMRAEVQADE